MRRIAFAAYCLLAASALLLAIEGVARLALEDDPSPLFADPALGRVDRPFVAADPRRGFALVPGFEDRVYRINSDGFRGPELPPGPVLARRFVVLAVGDSATFGWKVAEGGPYPAQLEASSARARRARCARRQRGRALVQLEPDPRLARGRARGHARRARPRARERALERPVRVDAAALGPGPARRAAAAAMGRGAALALAAPASARARGAPPGASDVFRPEALALYAGQPLGDGRPRARARRRRRVRGAGILRRRARACRADPRSGSRFRSSCRCAIDISRR
jgi:hypothetical protein